MQTTVSYCTLSWTHDSTAHPISVVDFHSTCRAWTPQFSGGPPPTSAMSVAGAPDNSTGQIRARNMEATRKSIHRNKRTMQERGLSCVGRWKGLQLIQNQASRPVERHNTLIVNTGEGDWIHGRGASTVDST